MVFQQMEIKLSIEIISRFNFHEILVTSSDVRESDFQEK
jgi:hypothetical protein